MLYLLTCSVTMVVLYSRSSDLATVFTFALTSPLQLPQSISDPFVLSLGEVQGEEASSVVKPRFTTQGRIPSTICLRPLANAYPSRAGSEEPGEDVVQSTMSFYQIFVLYKDLGVSERLYFLVGDDQDQQRQHLAQMKVSNAAKTFKSLIRKNFIIPDAFISDVEAADSPNEVSSHEHVRSIGRRELPAATREPWVFDMRWLAKTIEDERSTATLRASSAEAFAKIIDDAMTGIDEQTAGIHVL